MAVRLATCGLCQEQRGLQDSHLLPASLYEIIRKHSGSPVVIQDGTAVQTSRQWRARLLCADCEQILNQRGEDWVLRNCYRGKGVFRLAALLREELTQGGPLAEGMYGLRSTTAVALNRLTHFAAGVFWRAAVRSWTLRRCGTPVRLRLGPYEERLRRFLLGGSAPQGVCFFVVLISRTTDDTAALYPPEATDRGDSYRHYQFLIPGLFFQVVLGSKIPRGLEMVSTHPGGCIHVANGSPWDEAMREVIVRSESRGRLGRRRW